MPKSTNEHDEHGIHAGGQFSVHALGHERPRNGQEGQSKNHHRSTHVPPCPKSGKDGCAVDGNGEDPHVTVASQGNVNVVFPPCRQGHVPSAPKVRRRGGPVGEVEVVRQCDAQQASHAFGHVGVATEVSVDLKAVAIQGDQHFPRVPFGGVLKGGVHHPCPHQISEHQFFEES